MSDFKYVYGPVPSRRMGLSLGISPIPKGHCNYSCIYCQLGRTRRMGNKRKEYFNCADIIEEFKDHLTSNVHFDVVTIVGEGEPLLYSKLGLLIFELKKLTSKPIALITNGALLSEPAVRKEVKEAHIVLPSLDACNSAMFKRINRPHANLTYENVIAGLSAFSQAYKGQLWLEIMLIKNINDNRDANRNLQKLLRNIKYHKLYINSPIRPPAESFVQEPSRAAIEEALSTLGGISIDKLVSEGFYSEMKDDYQAVLSIIKRHPMNQFEIKSFLKSRGNGESEAEDFLHSLEHDSSIEVVDYKNYYTYRLK